VNKKSKANPATNQADKQRMAGEVWREYDASSQGGAGFDGKDLKQLVKDGWSYNNIYKAAAAAGHVNANADRQLKLLGTKESKYSPLKKDGFRVPGDVFYGAVDMFGEGANDSESLRNRVRFLGGDPNKAKNWITANSDKDKASAQASSYYGSLGNDDGLSWHRPNTRWSDEKGKQQDVYTWGGLDGEGRALALNGISIKGDDSKFNRQNRGTSWTLPQDVVLDRRRGDVETALATINAEKPATPADGAGGLTAEQPKTVPTFNLNDWRTSPSSVSNETAVTNESTSSGSSDNYKVIAPKPVTPDIGDDSFYIGGFESKINKLYDRPMDWTGDVWDQGESKRFASSSRFREGLRERTGF
jgi:hypothetical protein